MARCRLCGKEGREISGILGFCVSCIRGSFQRVWPEIKRLHDESRSPYGLAPDPPNEELGTPCGLCMHQCRIPEGGSGFCGIRKVQNGVVKGGRPHEASVSWYHDPLPTNCVADWVCAGGTGSGYPVYAKKPRPERGFLNLAVFYHACSFNCLYCQNAHFKKLTHTSPFRSCKELTHAVTPNTTCICFFGGDPTPQILHALKASKLARSQRKGDILRICWETNGAVNEPFLWIMASLSLESGGCIKFDLKAWDERVHMALTGVSNRKTLSNFAKLASWFSRRDEPPFLVASTLLVPGYVDEEEVLGISRFLAGLDPWIPYSLLAFYPSFVLVDLPTTSREHAQRCLEAAYAGGLKRVRLGNVHLLGPRY